MKIKIVCRMSELPMTDKEEIVYDIYVGFTGIPKTFPFHHLHIKISTSSQK